MDIVQLLLEHKLIDTEQNVFVRQYADFIIKRLHTTLPANLKYHIHHAIPVCVFAYETCGDPTNRTVGLHRLATLDTTDNVLVKLTLSEHVFAHSLLAAATTCEWFKIANLRAVELLLQLTESTVPKRIRIFKDGTTKMVNNNLLESYLDNGWSTVKSTEVKTNQASSANVWMHRGDSNLKVSSTQVFAYLRDGFTLGTSRAKYRANCYINRDGTVKRISIVSLMEQLDALEADGWTFGK